MKVLITRMYFDGMRRHREGSVIAISDKKYMKASEIPATSRKKVGDVIAFAPSCMQIVESKAVLVDVPRPTPGKTPAVPPQAPPAPAEEASPETGEQSLANQEVI